MKAMILAAGLGERLRPLTETNPKPMLLVGGKPLLQYHLERLSEAGIQEVVINTSWLAEKIESYFGDGSQFGLQINWSRESHPLETGGGIRRALPYLGDEPFLLISGDIWTEYPLGRLCHQPLKRGVDAHLVLVNSPKHNPMGDFTLHDNKIGYPVGGEQEVVKHTFSGISLLRPEIFVTYRSYSDTFPLRDVWRTSIEEGKVTGELYSGQWWDVGTIERYRSVNQYLLDAGH